MIRWRNVFLLLFKFCHKFLTGGSGRVDSRLYSLSFDVLLFCWIECPGLSHCRRYLQTSIQEKGLGAGLSYRIQISHGLLRDLHLQFRAVCQLSRLANRSCKYSGFSFLWNDSRNFHNNFLFQEYRRKRYLYCSPHRRAGRISLLFFPEIPYLWFIVIGPVVLIVLAHLMNPLFVVINKNKT